jgi:HK97 family phage prohead protease
MRTPLSDAPAVEARALRDARLDVGDTRRIRGYALVFNRLSEDLGGFVEQIAPEFVNRTLQQGLDVRALFNHDSGAVLGRTTAGTLTLQRDVRGLAVTIDPPNPTEPPNLLESIRRGDISGMSFAFRTFEDNWDFKADPPIRTLLDGEIREISIVTFPAYPDTSVGVRALEEARGAGRGWKPSLAFRERLWRAQR